MGNLSFKALMISELWKRELRICQGTGAISQLTSQSFMSDSPGDLKSPIV